jgi:protease I
VSKTIAFVLETDYEDSEFQEPYDALRGDGHTCVVIGTEEGKELHGKKGKSSITVEKTAAMVDAGEFDALVIPGGYSPDKLRLDDDIVALTRKFMESGRPVAAICHAGQLLVEAGVVRDRTVTSWPSVRTELELAGADWVDREVVVDENLITSRNPGDIPAFIEALRERL